MVSYISGLIETYKRKASLEKWVEELMVTARQRAYENRSTIYKRELEDDLRRLRYIIPLWEKFKKLRKKSPDYDVLIDVDRRGYITMQVTFPITEKEYADAKELKHEWAMNNKGYGFCCRLGEMVYKVSHERVEKVFSGITLNAHNSYEVYGSNNLVRWCDIVSVK